MNRNIRSIIFCITFLALILFNIPVLNVVAASQTETTDLDISKTLEPYGSGDAYNIVFNLPVKAVEEPVVVDMVFVMDMTSIDQYSTVKAQIDSFLDRMVADPAVKLNVGVVRFALNITTATNALESVTQATVQTVKGRFSSSFASGSNMYGALLAGERLLDTGSASKANKYLVIASDFGGYKSDTGDGRGQSFYFVNANDPNGVEALHNNQAFHGRYAAYNTWASAEAFFSVQKTDDLIRRKVLYNGTQISESMSKYIVESGSSVGEFPDCWRNSSELAMLISCGFSQHTWTAAEKAQAIPNYQFTQQNEFPTSFEKNIYQSGNEFLRMKEKYNVIAVTSPYHKLTETDAYRHKYRMAAESFKKWFAQNIGERYEITENQSFVTMLQDLEHDIVYYIGKGQITDVVRSDFKVVPQSQLVTLNDVVLTKTTLSDGSVAFGAPIGGIYPYVYRYTINNGVEQFTWEINRESRRDDVLRLSNMVTLVTIPTTVGVHEIDSNVSARIDYMSSKEVLQGEPEYTKFQTLPSPFATVTIGSFTANYLDDQGNVLLTPVTTTGRVGSAFDRKEIMIPGYERIRTDGTTRSTYSVEHSELTYVYQRIARGNNVGAVHAHYVDSSGTPLRERITHTGNVGDGFATNLHTFNGYTFVRLEGQDKGVFENTERHVTYVYSKSASTVIPDAGAEAPPYITIGFASITLGTALMFVSGSRRTKRRHISKT